MTDIKTIAADVADFLKKHPEKWMQGFYARDSKGEDCNWRSPDACRCLEGHVMYRAALGVETAYYQSRAASEAVRQLVEIGYGMGVFPLRDAAHWNDQPGRTVADVIELCERVARGQS